MQKPIVGMFAALLLVSASAYAHVSLQPRESAPGETVTYTMRVPTEGTVNTTSIELEIPDSVTVVSIDGPSESYEAKKVGERIVAITWKTDIAPKQFKTFTFVAKNPSAASEVSWKAHQHFADGTAYDWVEPAGSKRPAARTKVAAATTDKPAMPADHKH
jgi:uncharacterized protein YcnI